MKRDTLQEKTIQFAPNFSKKKVKSLGNYVGVVDDSLAFQFSSGISVLNTLRGHVPNTGISVDAPFATVRDNAAFIIDGLLYRQNPGSSYNMNTFDYTSITVLSRANATSAYGVYGGNGGFVIKSKTGDGYSKPTFEFNAYTTGATTNKLGSNSIIVSPGPPSYTAQNADGQSYLSHSLAYMQDFGKIDTRVSYNWVNRVSGVNSHNIKINTGFALHQKFKARLIVDNIYNVYHDSWSVSDYIVSDSSNYQIVEIRDSTDTVIDSVFQYVRDSAVVRTLSEKLNRNFLQGNLMLQYDPTRWLTITSQSSWGKVSDTHETIGDKVIQSRFDQRRSLVNLFATINTKIGSSFSFSPFTGMQYESWESHKKHSYGNGFAYSDQAYEEKYYLAGFDLDVKDILFAHVDRRQDILSMYGSQLGATYSTSLAFIFSEAFGWNSSAFSFGKVRASLGRMYQDKYDDNNLFRIPEKVFEVGTDLTFANNRLGVTLNYFNEKENEQRHRIFASTGNTSGWLSNGNLHETGYEIIVNAIPVKFKRLEYTTTLLWMSSKEIIEDGYSGNIGHGLDNATPGWTSSLLNQVTWKNFALSFLFDARKGGTFYSYAGSTNGFPDLNTYDGTQVKLRDLTIGYRFPTSILKYIRIKQAYVSTSWRNLALLYSSSGKDIDASMSIAQKTTSLNLSLLF